MSRPHCLISISFDSYFRLLDGVIFAIIEISLKRVVLGRSGGVERGIS